MVVRFKIVATASFSRSLKKLAAKHPEIPEVYEGLLIVLQHDPLNISRQHPIKKLTNVEVGQWRIRAGVYRLRYDVDGHTVILHSINHRSTVY